MNDQLKNKWNNLDVLSDIPGFGFKSIDQFLSYRSDTIFNKIRWIFYGDFFRKLVGTIFIIADLIIYHDKEPLIILLSVLLTLQLSAIYLEARALRDFNHIADPGKTPKDNLSAVLVFLNRRFILPLFSISSSFVFIFVPGLLLYFELAYGYIKPLKGMEFIAFGGLCLIGIVMSFASIQSDINYHIKHLRICLSDLNEDTLYLVSENLESRRKQHQWKIVLISLALIFGFIVLLAVLKSSMR